MATAIVYPEPKQGRPRKGEGKRLSDLTFPAVEKVMLSQARTVLREFGKGSNEVKEVMLGMNLGKAAEG